jgi:hypothetical protein
MTPRPFVLVLLAAACSGEIDESDPQTIREDLPCLDGSCEDPDPCASARAAKSYVGCSYWPTVTVNAALVEDFGFAVVVANANPVPVEVTVASGNNPAFSKTTIAPNDLLPDHALNKEYLVIALPTQGQNDGAGWSSSPGFFAVVATSPGKTRVEVRFSAETAAGAGDLRSYQKGETASFTLDQGAVLQILSRLTEGCAAPTTHGETSFCEDPDSDLTGTAIRADQSIQVISGHNCAMVPFDRFACDHLEEQLFPLQSWGKRYLLAHTASSGKNPSRYRIVSGDDGNQIVFSPAVHPPVLLQRGAHLDLETGQPFEVTGSKRLAVVQLMVGQDYAGDASSGAPGDPAMALAVPVEQYRTSYGFLAPASYQQNYVNVITPSAATGKIRFDGKAVARELFKPIGQSGFSAGALKIVGGAHRLEGAAPFGISVYGVGAYTSYMFPGGLDLRVLID